MKTKPATVAELIKRLSGLKQDLPVYIRSKYTGDVRWCDDHPLSINGVGEMEANDEIGEHVSILY